MTRSLMVACVVLAFALFARSAEAQAPKDGRIVATVADTSGAIVPGATVTVVGLEDITKKTAIAPAKTNDKGIATFDGLVLGRYSIQVEFPGFDLGLLRDIKIKSGDNKHVIVLPLKKIENSVTVGPDKLAAATDRTTTFGSALTREQIAALSDNPDELKQQLQDMAGPDAVFRVDSFEGADLPAKSQIKSIHITRDTFAAENHVGGGLFIDIITQPGQGKIRVGTNYNVSGSKLEARNALLAVKAPDMSQFFGGNIGGSLIKDKSSFSLNFNGGTSYTTPNLYAQTTTGLNNSNLNLQQRFDNKGFNGLLDYALTRDQTLRFSFNGNMAKQSNLGIGQTDLAERAYTSDSSGFSFRAQEAGPLGRRFFVNTRLQGSFRDSSTQSATEAQTIQVLDSFTSGGAQKKGGVHSKTFNFASDLDYVRGINSWRTGVQLDGTSYHADTVSNYLGTYLFTSLAAYQAGTPASFTRMTGDPNVSYFNLNAGLYLQDDVRVRKNLTLSPGIRYEAQTHVSDYNALSPRFGATWSPFKNGRTSIQSSIGIFHEYLSTSTYQTTLQNDGAHLLELDVANPSFPNPGIVGSISPTQKYLIGPDFQMQQIRRATVGLSQQLGSRWRVDSNYSYQRVHGIPRGVNLNAPVNGVRPDPNFVNVLETVSDGSSIVHNVSTNLSISFAAPSPALQQAHFNWRRTTINANYNWRHATTNATGTFTPPESGTLDGEWGPSGEDVHHRGLLGINTQMLKNMNANINISGATGSPYNETTGLDNNGDLIFNDRPIGVTRNSLRTSGNWQVNSNFSYTFGIGKQTAPGGGGGMGMPGGPIVIMGGGGGVSGGDIARMITSAQTNVPPKYSLFVSVNLQNLTNHANYFGYVGNQLSNNFLQATTAGQARRMSVSMGFNF